MLSVSGATAWPWDMLSVSGATARVGHALGEGLEVRRFVGAEVCAEAVRGGLCGGLEVRRFVRRLCGAACAEVCWCGGLCGRCSDGSVQQF